MLETIPFPEVNASLNGLATLLLTAGFFAILRRQVAAHRAAMLSALIVSIVFLVSYVTSKTVAGRVNTPFGGEGFWAYVYYFILITHVILAMVIVPLVLRTLYLALRQRYALHRKWARVTFPLWYYVSVTGVLVYFFLFQWFPSEGH